MEHKGHKTSCWIITEGLAGTENQCIGVAQALNLLPDVKKISLNQPWKMLSPYLGFEQGFTFTPKLSAPSWPDLLITSGRKSIAASRYIKRTSKKKTVTVHIQDPRIPSKYFDLVVVPEHDPLRGENVFVTKASPNKITPNLINFEKQKFNQLEKLGAPRIAILIGGKSKAYDMDANTTKKLAQTLKKLPGSLMITCSRRTSPKNRAILEQHLDTDQNFFWDGEGDNPYFGLLGYADYILVTADSASMLSESCSTGKPVYMIPMDGGARRISLLHQNLIQYGCLRTFEGELTPFDYSPLNDAELVANEIRKRFGPLLNGLNS